MRMSRALCTAADCSCCRLLLLRLCDRFMLKCRHLHIAVLQPERSIHPGCKNRCGTEPRVTFQSKRSARRHAACTRG